MSGEVYWITSMQANIDSRLLKSKGKDILSKRDIGSLTTLSNDIREAQAMLSEYQAIIDYRSKLPKKNGFNLMRPQDVKKKS